MHDDKEPNFECRYCKGTGVFSNYKGIYKGYVKEQCRACFPLPIKPADKLFQGED